MKVFDIFPFNNELELLKIRFEVLNPVVDHFVIVEAPNDFYGNEKPFIYEQNKNLFEEFNSKVIHIKLPRFNFGFSFANDAFQKNIGFWYLMNDTKDDDVFIYSDMDEIPNPKYIKEFKNNPVRPICVKNQFNHYAIDVRITNVTWYGSMIFQKSLLYDRYKDLKDFRELANYKDFTYGIRDKRNDTSIFDVKENGGWHYTYLVNKNDGLNNILNKVQNHTHSELHYIKMGHIKDCVKSLKPLNPQTQDWKLENFKLDETNTPEYILNNLDKYQHLLYHNII